MRSAMAQTSQHIDAAFSEPSLLAQQIMYIDEDLEQNLGPGSEAIKLEDRLKLKIERNNWLLLLLFLERITTYEKQWPTPGGYLNTCA